MKPSPGPWTFQGSISGTNDREGPFVLVRLGVKESGTADEDTGLLAALAPEMREMLLKHEWDGAYDDNDSGCPECLMPRGNIDDPPRHKTNCALDALLEKLR